MKPSGDRLIEYHRAVTRAAAKAFPNDVLRADAWHMGWIARRIGRARSDGPTVTTIAGAWISGWEAAGGTWEEVGSSIMPGEFNAEVSP